MEYKLEKYTISEIYKIKDTWCRLQQGEEMTYFQTYNWYDMLSKVNNGVISSNFVVFFYVVYKNDMPMLIAPLWIIRKNFRKCNKKGIYLYGCQHWTDYCNFIYINFEDDACNYLFNSVKQEYDVTYCRFDNLKKTSSLNKYITRRFCTIGISENKCAELFLPSTFEEYKASLSKHSRQNIRTAKNRLKKDSIEWYVNINDTQINRKTFDELRLLRVLKKKNDFKLFSIRGLRHRLVQKLTFYFPLYKPYFEDLESRFMSMYTSNGTLCASFNYGYSEEKKEIVLMAVATNPQYEHYSPGIILLESFIEQQYKKYELSKIDFTRGDEPYKYQMGGIPHYVTQIQFSI